MKKKIIALLATISLVTFTTIVVGDVYKAEEKWKVTFEDNFEGNELNTDLWEKCPEWERHGGGRWDDDASYVDGNGNLVLDILPDPDKPGKVLSGAVRTNNKFEQTYGYYEARIKFPVIKGAWGAFWLMSNGVSNVDNSGQDGTEVDIIESIYNEQNRANHALHWDGYDAAHKKSAKELFNVSLYDGEFHTFGLHWTKDEYVFYIDGKETWRTNAGGVCQNPQYMKLTTEAASWAGHMDTSNLPKQMLVDYVKVYSEK